MYKQDGTETTEVKEASYIKTDYLAKINDIDNNRKRGIIVLRTDIPLILYSGGKKL